MKPIRFLSTILVYFLFSSYSYASYLDDWPDDALCGWMQNPSPPEHILKEVEKRRLKCIDGIAVGIDTSIQSSELSGVQIYEITFSDELRDELLAIAPIESASDFTKSFKNYQLAFIQDKLTCAFYLRRVIYENKVEGEIEDWYMAQGSLIIDGSEVFIDGNWRMGGLSSDPKYLKDEVNLRLTKDGHLVGKMAYFNLNTTNGEIPIKPMFVELKKHPRSEPLNYKDKKNKNAKYWIDVEDWAGGVMTVFGCQTESELNQKKVEKEQAQKAYKESVEKRKKDFKSIKKIYKRKNSFSGTTYSINYLDGIFEANLNPKYSKNPKENQLHKARISGMIMSKQLNTQVDFKTLASIRESDEYLVLVISVAEDEEQEMNPLKSFARPSIEKCGELPGFYWDKLSFVVSTKDIELAKQQKCYFDFFENNTNKRANRVYKAIFSGSPSIAKYLKSNDI